MTRIAVLDRGVVPADSADGPAQGIKDHVTVRRGNARVAFDHDIDGIIRQLFEIVRLPVVPQPRRIEVLDDTLQSRVGHGPHLVRQGGTEAPQRTKPALSFFDGPDVAEQGDGGLRPIRQSCQHREATQFVRSGAGEFVIQPQEALGLVHRVDHEAAEHRPDRVEPVFEGCHDAKVSSPASQSPEEVRVLGGAGPQEQAVRGDDVRRKQVVARQSMLAHEKAMTAPKRQSCDPGWAGDAPGGRQAERLSLLIEITPGDAPFSPCRPLCRIDTNALHAGQIDHEPPITDGEARDPVSAAAYRQQHVVVASKFHRSDDIRGSCAAANHRGASVDHPVMDLAGSFVTVVARAQELAA